MNKFWLSAAVIIAAVGCGQDGSAPSTDSAVSASAPQESLPEGVTLVTLKLPGMT